MRKTSLINPVQANSSKYHDPLNKDSIVLMSYSNEIGTAISEISPKLGTALWIPTFMYLGADIYDKYKNDKDNYNPSSKRAFERAIFQGMTSLVAMPAVILAGQYAVSPLAKFYKSGISGNTKDAIYRHTKSIIDQAQEKSFDSFENFNELVQKTLKNKINARKGEKQTLNIFKKLYRKLFTSRYELLNSDETKTLDFAKKNAFNTFNILTALKNNDKENIPPKIYKKYTQVLPVMKEMYKDDDYSYHAARAALKEYQNSLIFKNKLLKTLGGFGAIIIFAKPVSSFIEKQIMKKYVNPGIDQLSETVHDKGLNFLFKDMGYKKFLH